MIVRLGAVLVFGVVAVTACDDGEPPPPSDAAVMDAGAMDLGPVSDMDTADVALDDGGSPVADAAPIPALPVDPERHAEPEIIAEDAVTAVFPLAEDVWIAEMAGTIQWVGEEALVPLDGAEGPLVGAISVADQALVGTDVGLFAVTDASLVVSPLDEHLSGVRAMQSTNSNTAWFVTGEGLQVWRDGRLHGFGLDGVDPDWAAVNLAAGRYRGLDALWLATGETVYALSFDGETPAAWAVEPGGTIGAMTTNVDGIWLALDHGLAHLDAQDNWHLWTLPFTIIAMAGDARAPDVWLNTDAGLHQLRDGRARRIADAPSFAGMVAAVDGSAVLWGDTGLYRVRPGRFVRLVGLQDGGTVQGGEVISVEATSPDTVTRVEVAFNGGDAAPVEGPPWSFTVDAQVLGAGAHAVEVTVHYADETAVSVVAHFEVVGPPTWRDVIEPLFMARCDQCHGPRGYAHRMETMETWIDEVDQIIDAVEAGRMPLTPNPLLEPHVIQLIRDWQAAGFPETWP